MAAKFGSKKLNLSNVIKNKKRLFVVICRRHGKWHKMNSLLGSGCQVLGSRWYNRTCCPGTGTNKNERKKNREIEGMRKRSISNLLLIKNFVVIILLHRSRLQSPHRTNLLLISVLFLFLFTYLTVCVDAVETKK